ncbi:ESX-1 secretion-associated protein [Mycolicibacterium baixiangningiae]|uniref:ESX-1 secretion-associated protein n=1 Tax=Mycolicibacterium baixiangningiae TaxID=2761578 RepID=UPI0018692412|nr:ESX-1 secretion-associated protein [Mycolicibacterium baixiangningiae]
MTDNLRVTASHVRQLAARQAEAAAGIETASTVTDGLGVAMWMTHGIICAPSNAAMGATESARDAACAAMKSVSNDLSTKLGTAAERYEGTDRAGRARLDEQMPPR